MYMNKLIKLNFCLEDNKGIFTMEQLARINQSLARLPLAIADPAYEVDDYISELFYVVLSRYYDVAPADKAKLASACIRNLFISNIRAKRIRFKYSYTMRLVAEGDYSRHAIRNDLAVIYTDFKTKKDFEVIKYIDEVVHILLYENKAVKDKEMKSRIGLSMYKLRKIKDKVREAYE